MFELKKVVEQGVFLLNHFAFLVHCFFTWATSSSSPVA
jgi:hypothetical protein